MAVSIQLGSYSLQSTTVITSQILHDGMPTQALNTLDVSRRDGLKLISASYRPKTITLVGTIKGTSISDLELNIDTFKKSVSATRGNLDIEYSGSNRRYIVSTESIGVERRNFHITFAPFSVVFQVLDPPFGLNISGLGGQLSANEALSAVGISSQSYSATISLDGTAPPQPITTYIIDTSTGLTEIAEQVVTKKSTIIVGTAFQAGDEVIIDTENQQVRRNGVPINYSGIFPEYDLGDNVIQSTFGGTAGIRVDQQQEISNGTITFTGGGGTAAQQFIVSTNGTYPYIEVLMRNPSQSTGYTLTLDVRTGYTGTDTGSVVTNSTKTLNISQVPSDTGWVRFEFSSAITLATGTTYAFQIKSNATLVTQTFQLRATNQPAYADGQVYVKTVLTDIDMAFRVIRSETPTWSVDKKIQYIKRYL